MGFLASILHLNAQQVIKGLFPFSRLMQVVIGVAVVGWYVVV